MRSQFAIYSLAISLCLGITNAFADEAVMGESFNKKFKARFAAFQASSNSELRIDSSGGLIGSTFSLEDDLGFGDRKTLPLFDFAYRFNSKHRIEFSYVDLSRSGVLPLNVSLTIDGNEYTAGTTVDSFFNSQVYRLAYGYSFINDGEKEISMLLGAHITKIGIGINTLDGALQYDTDATLPLPTIGLTGSYAFTPKFRINGWGQLFALKYEEYEGSLINASADIEYDLFENLGIGLGYTYYGYNLSAEGDRLRGEIDYNFSGPMLFANLTF